MQTYKTHLTKKEQVTEHVYLLEFKLDEPEHLQFVAGQYMMLLCPHTLKQFRLVQSLQATQMYHQYLDAKQRNKVQGIIY